MENTNRFNLEAANRLPEIIDVNEIDEARRKLLADRLSIMLQRAEEDTIKKQNDKNNKNKAIDKAMDYGVAGFLGFGFAGLLLAPLTGGLSLGLAALSIGTGILGDAKRKSEMRDEVNAAKSAVITKIKEAYIEEKEKALVISPEQRQRNAEIVHNLNIGKKTGKHDGIEITNLVMDGKPTYLPKSNNGQSDVLIVGSFVNGKRNDVSDQELDGAIELRKHKTVKDGQTHIEYAIKLSTANSEVLDFDNKIMKQLNAKGFVSRIEKSQNPHSSGLPGQHTEFSQVFLTVKGKDLGLVRTMLENEYGLAQVGLGNQMIRHMLKTGVATEEVTPTSAKEERAPKVPVATPYSTMRAPKQTATQSF